MKNQKLKKDKQFCLKMKDEQDERINEILFNYRFESKSHFIREAIDFYIAAINDFENENIDETRETY